MSHPSNDEKSVGMIERAPIPDLLNLSAAQQKVHDDIVEGQRGRLDGPLAIWLHSADLAHYAEQLGEFCRYRTSLPPVLSELLILIMAESWQAGLEWSIHAPIALQAGLPSTVVEAIGRGEIPHFDDERQSLVYEFGKTLLDQKKVADITYAQAVETLGTKSVVEMVGILGYYSLISMTIKAFKLTIPEGGRAPFS